MIEAGEAVRFDAVSKTLGNHQALSSVSFMVPAGSVFGLVGANGAGKTTTLRLILGLLVPDQGTLRVLGDIPLKAGANIRRRTGVLLETDGLYSRMSALDNLGFYADIWHMKRMDFLNRAGFLLQSFDLWDRRHEKVATWSRGMRVKLALSRALLQRPALLLLDEPFAGLDPVSATSFRLRLAELAGEEGISTLIASHDLAHVEQVCQNVAVIQAGRLLYCGPPEDINKQPLTESVRVLVASPDLSEQRLEHMVQSCVINGFRAETAGLVLTCSLQQRKELGRYFMGNGLIVDELTELKASLEQSVLSLLSQGREGTT